MLRQASSRNQKSKGFKVKHALQICLLVAICIWLLYQVKHSHEKKRAFEERKMKMTKVGDSQADFFKFGRKDLPQIEEPVSVNETRNEENEEPQEEEEEQDTKQEEIEDEEGRDAGDDEGYEQDQDRVDEEAEHEEESTEENDKDNHEEEKDSHEEIDLFDNHEQEGGTQEAREENYRRDDASSAVVHDPRVSESENGTGGAGNTDKGQVIDKADDDSSADHSKGVNDTSSDESKSEVVGENLVRKIVESENVTAGSEDGSKGDDDLSAGSGGAFVGNASDTVSKVAETIRQIENFPSNVTAADNKDAEIEFSKPDNGSVSGMVEFNSPIEVMEQQTNVTAAAESNTLVELQTTGGVADHLHGVQNNSLLVLATGSSMSNDTAGLDSTQNQNIGADNATVGQDSRTSQNSEEAENNSDTNVVLDSEEHSTASSTEGELEKDTLTDVSTLPEIQNEVKTTDNDAAER